MAGVVKVKLGSPFNEIAGLTELTLEIHEGDGEPEDYTLGRVLDDIGARVGVLRRLFSDPVQRKYFLCTVNGVKVGEMHPVHPGDGVDISSPILGG